MMLGVSVITSSIVITDIAQRIGIVEVSRQNRKEIWLNLDIVKHCAMDGLIRTIAKLITR
jgi:RNase P/RNase MRP subunit POP5